MTHAKLRKELIYKFGSLGAAAARLDVNPGVLSAILSPRRIEGIPKRCVKAWADLLGVSDGELIPLMGPRARADYLAIIRAGPGAS